MMQGVSFIVPPSMVAVAECPGKCRLSLW